MRRKLFAAATILACFSFSNGPLAENLSIEATPIPKLLPGSESSNFGGLEFLGGLILESKHSEFGGLSGIRFLDENELVLLTDKARVITATLTRKNGRPSGLKYAEITRIKRANGRTITGASDKDSEALEIAEDTYFVGYERNDRLLRLRMRNNTLFAENNYLVDFNTLEFPNNKGPEAIAIHPETRKLYVFAEHARNKEGNHRGFIVSGGKIEREMSVYYTGRYSITDAAFLPNGDLLLLERYFNPFTRVYMRIRKFNSEDLSASIPMDGETLIEIDSTHLIDNMEGLAVTELADGSNRLTIVSDDNFSERQKTILLEFKMD